VEAPQPKTGFSLGATRELLLPVTLMGCFALYYLAHQPFWVVVACAAPMLALYALAPSWAARSLVSFDRDAVRILAARKPAELRGRYNCALGLRLFAPPALRAERKAMMLAEVGEAQAAHAAYREAYEEHTGNAPLRVMLGYAHASFAIGDDRSAIELYRRLLSSAGSLPGVERNLAHALIRQGQDLPEALERLARAEREPNDPERQLERKLLIALAHAKQGERTDAERMLASIPPSEASEPLRESVREALLGVTTPRA
jgi:tetratricopeptide (TPR) repeat protein